MKAIRLLCLRAQLWRAKQANDRAWADYLNHDASYASVVVTGSRVRVLEDRLRLVRGEPLP